MLQRPPMAAESSPHCHTGWQLRAFRAEVRHKVPPIGASGDWLTVYPMADRAPDEADEYEDFAGTLPEQYPR